MSAHGTIFIITIIAIVLSRHVVAKRGRYLLVDMVQEQMMCSFLAFSEWLRLAADSGNRTLVVPSPRFDEVNLSATVRPWERCLKRHERTTHKAVVLRRDASYAISRSCEGATASSFRVKISRCRGYGCDKLPDGLSECKPQRDVGEKCYHLKGTLYLKR
jgi:hypothetical protein